MAVDVLQELQDEYNNLLTLLPDACRDRMNALRGYHPSSHPDSSTINAQAIKGVVDANRDIRYALQRLRRDNKKFIGLISNNEYVRRHLFDTLHDSRTDEKASQHRKFLQSYIALFNEELQDVFPQVKRLIRLLGKQASQRDPSAFVDVEKEIRSQTTNVTRIINENYHNQLQVLVHREAPGSSQEKYLNTGEEDPFWAFVKLISAITIFLNSVGEIIREIEAKRVLEPEMISAARVRWRLEHIDVVAGLTNDLHRDFCRYAAWVLRDKSTGMNKGGLEFHLTLAFSDVTDDRIGFTNEYKGQPLPQEFRNLVSAFRNGGFGVLIKNDLHTILDGVWQWQGAEESSGPRIEAMPNKERHPLDFPFIDTRKGTRTYTDPELGKVTIETELPQHTLDAIGIIRQRETLPEVKSAGEGTAVYEYLEQHACPHGQDLTMPRTEINQRLKEIWEFIANNSSRIERETPNALQPMMDIKALCMGYY